MRKEEASAHRESGPQATAVGRKGQSSNIIEVTPSPYRGSCLHEARHLLSQGAQGVGQDLWIKWL